LHVGNKKVQEHLHKILRAFQVQTISRTKAQAQLLQHQHQVQKKQYVGSSNSGVGAATKNMWGQDETVS